MDMIKNLNRPAVIAAIVFLLAIASAVAVMRTPDMRTMSTFRTQNLLVDNLTTFGSGGLANYPVSACGNGSAVSSIGSNGIASCATHGVTNPAVGIIATTAAIANTETVVVSMTIPANTLVAGQSFTLWAAASTNGGTGGTAIARLRLGPTTLTGPIVATVSKAEINPPATRLYEAEITIRSIGASGTALGEMAWIATNSSGFDATTRNTITSPVTIDTTVTNHLEFTYISGAVGVNCSFSQAVLSQVQ